MYAVSRDLSHNDSPILSSSSTLAVPLSAAPYCPLLHDLLGHNKVDGVIVLRKILVGLAPVHGAVAVSASRVSIRNSSLHHVSLARSPSQRVAIPYEKGSLDLPT